MERARAVFPNVSYSADPYEVARGADALLMLDRVGAVPADSTGSASQPRWRGRW